MARFGCVFSDGVVNFFGLGYNGFSGNEYRIFWCVCGDFGRIVEGIDMIRCCRRVIGLMGVVCFLVALVALLCVDSGFAQGRRGRVGRSCCSGLMDLENYDKCALGGSTPQRIRPNSRCRLKADDSQSHSC